MSGRLHFFVCGYRERDLTGRSATGYVACGGVIEVASGLDRTHLLTCPRCGLPYETVTGVALGKETDYYQSLLPKSAEREYRHMIIRLMGRSGAERIGFGTPASDLMIRPGDDLLAIYGLSTGLPKPDASMNTIRLPEGPWERLTPATPGYRRGAELGVLLVKNQTTGRALEAAPFWRQDDGPYALQASGATAPHRNPSLAPHS